jgi:hypothetical protein
LLLVTASWLLPSVTVPETAFVHLLLALQARPLYSPALVILSFLASSSEAALFLFLIERMRLSLSPHPQLSVIAQNAFLSRIWNRSPLGSLGRLWGSLLRLSDLGFLASGCGCLGGYCSALFDLCLIHLALA